MRGQQWLAIMGTIGILAFPAVDARAASQAHSDQKDLQGEKHVQGIVEDIKSDQIQVNIGEVQPRFIPLTQAKEKGIPDIKKGDHLIVNGRPDVDANLGNDGKAKASLSVFADKWTLVKASK